LLIELQAFGEGAIGCRERSGFAKIRHLNTCPRRRQAAHFATRSEDGQEPIVKEAG
jgi:hypothetical protein